MIYETSIGENYYQRLLKYGVSIKFQFVLKRRWCCRWIGVGEGRGELIKFKLICIKLVGKSIYDSIKYINMFCTSKLIKSQLITNHSCVWTFISLGSNGNNKEIRLRTKHTLFTCISVWKVLGGKISKSIKC